jgi:hypothetical protein
MEDPPVVIPDAGPWITLAYADALDLLLKPGWPVAIQETYAFRGWDDRSVNPSLGGIARRDQITERVV